jgi:hypothetical protein
MKDWIAKKFRAGRFAMNLKLLEEDVRDSSIDGVAAIIVAAASMLVKVRSDDFITGSGLTKAATESTPIASEDALFFYNALEDILAATEAHRKQVIQKVTALTGPSAAKEVDRQARLQQSGLRLLMVSLARKVDADFKPKAHILQEKLYSAKSAIPAAVVDLETLATLTKSALEGGESQDYEQIQTTAELFSYSFLGW